MIRLEIKYKGLTIIQDQGLDFRDYPFKISNQLLGIKDQRLEFWNQRLEMIRVWWLGISGLGQELRVLDQGLGIYRLEIILLGLAIRDQDQKLWIRYQRLTISDQRLGIKGHQILEMMD